jgi:chemotaxis regulatin CheY-phosphate phosphatase CheZ
MKQFENMSKLFSKLDDLKKVFSYGEKLIPIIQKLGEFMKETAPLLENINNSIAESTSKIPKATNQIQNVSTATEMATTEILDLVDSINDELTNIQKTMVDILGKETDKEEFLLKLIPLLNVEKPNVLIKEFLNKNSSSEKLGELLLQVGKMKIDANSIALSLQVQDITSQQLAAVNHLIESVQTRLAALIDDFDSAKISDQDLNMNISENVSFDPNARYSRSEVPQQEVDLIFSKDEQKASQEEIDKLFN